MSVHLSDKRCAPCEGGTPALSRDEARELSTQTPHWELSDHATHIRRSFTFDDFRSALAFVNAVGELAESEGHHPDIELGWGRVEITLTTHAVKGLSENDFILASKIDTLPQ